MDKLNDGFKPNYENAKSNPKAIFSGKSYRITVLSESLIRLEYDLGGVFEDRPTELAINRNFNVPKFDVQENDKFLVITTKFFRLQYIKEKPFNGTMLAPDSNLRIALLDTDKNWYYGHDEARNFMSVNNTIETKDIYISQADKLLAQKNKKAIKKTDFKLKGLYSTDGFATIDDSKSLIIDENGYLIKDERPRVDIYLFMYRRDFGVCLEDYFNLTGYPPLIPRYALGIWWNKTKPYSFNEIKDLVLDFNKNKIPLSVILLGDTWHIKDNNNLSRYKRGFTFNNELFPNPQELITYLHERGLRIGLNIDPSEGINVHEKAYETLANSLNIKESQIIPFNAFDKNFMATYLSNLIDPLQTLGIDLFWIDYYTKDQKSLNSLNYYQYFNFNKNKAVRPLLMSR